MTDNAKSLDLTKSDDSRAVSPVIGVILMVAITIILAAVIGAFVLGFSTDTETPPNTAWDSNQQPAALNADESDLESVTFTLETTDRTIDGDNLDVVFPDTDDLDRVEGLDDSYSAGDAIVVDEDMIENLGGELSDIDVDDRVRVVWMGEDTSSIQATHTIN